MHMSTSTLQERGVSFFPFSGYARCQVLRSELSQLPFNRIRFEELSLIPRQGSKLKEDVIKLESAIRKETVQLMKNTTSFKRLTVEQERHSFEPAYIPTKRSFDNTVVLLVVEDGGDLIVYKKDTQSFTLPITRGYAVVITPGIVFATTNPQQSRLTIVCHCYKTFSVRNIVFRLRNLISHAFRA